ncbi:MAG: FAD-dependent oxidoreductase [Eggerthella lenta]
MIGHFGAVVGSGFAGSVMARELAERGGKRVLVIEKKPHIAGNMYDEADEAGILVHRYGPHIFHTNDKRAFDYVRRFTEWRDYQHEVLADWYGTYMPVPFNKNSMEIAFGEERASQLIEKLIATFGDERKVTITELRSVDDPDLTEVADFIYKNVFLYYTQKQWGLTPEEVDPSVTARVPVFLSRDNRYFQDAYQGMPLEGYTPLFERMLDHERIMCLKPSQACSNRFESNDENALSAIHQGAPSSLSSPGRSTSCSRRVGRLPYRSLISCTDARRRARAAAERELLVTRITSQSSSTSPPGNDKTTIMKEYSRSGALHAIINDETPRASATARHVARLPSAGVWPAHGRHRPCAGARRELVG